MAYGIRLMARGIFFCPLWVFVVKPSLRSGTSVQFCIYLQTAPERN